MKNIVKKPFIVIAILGISTVFSCKKFIDIGQPKNQLTSAEVFADSTDATASILGVYITIMNNSLGLSSGGLTLFPGLSADELYETSVNTTYNQYYVDDVLTTNNINNGFWSAGYNYIYSANACIEGVTQSTGISAAGKVRIIAEARFFRGFVYFSLVNLYGGVPLVTTANYQVSGVAARSAPDLVYAQITADLQYAEANLGNNTGANDRPNALAASALLAKVYLYEGKYDLAQTEAAKVINSGSFRLEPDLNNVFLSRSSETIWQLDLPFVKYTWEGQNFVPTSVKAIPRYVLTAGLYASFEPGDRRQTNWIKVNTVSAQNYPYPFKYKNNATATSATENYVVLRLADQYLIRAEAEANQNDFSDAANDLNTIRNRAGLPNSTATGKPSLMSAIVNERRREFFCEWGNRWFDLKRENLAVAVLGQVKTNWNINDELYPIPITQINNNPNLVQNPGY